MFLGALIFDRLLPLAVVFVSIIPIVVVGKSLREWVKALRGITPFFIIIFAANFLTKLFGGGHPVTGEILESSATMALRFMILTLSVSIFLISTSPDDFSLALQKSRIPFEICFAFTLAMRFVPVLAINAQSIMDAQRCRGLELDRGRLTSRIKNHIPILFLLVVNSIKRSLELAEAMESRGYGLKKERTSLYTLKLKDKDYIVLGFVILAIIILVYVRLTVTMPAF
jgi:energy-coupling factor transport system permease protein